ncbi:signal peptidase I [Metabacillus halosaccharovorans]|uniref:signal peptidase I n=1 Tax=Metabacillus halosaccharovorans TaxID=930124 RepID=UPI00403DABF7
MLVYRIDEAMFIIKVLKKYGVIELPAEGTSMFPLIKEGDICHFVSCETISLQRGDIALFFSTSGKLVAHRLYQTKKVNNCIYFLFKGDSNLGLDHPVHSEQIIGKLTYIQKRAKKISSKSMFFSFWSKVILKVPFTSYLLRYYLNKIVFKPI